MYNILIVEDDKRINEGIKFNLELDGFKAFSSLNLVKGREILKDKNIDLIILDVNLPDGNGFNFCEEIRKESNVPIIFLTANDMEMDQIRGFRLGADDYVTKPFSISILTRRVIAILKRSTISEVKSGEYSLNLDKMRFTKNNSEIFLSKIEFKIVKKLIENEGKVISRDELLSELWDENLEFVEEHTLTVNINRIRNKLEDKTIKTIYRKGYIWRLEDE